MSNEEVIEDTGMRLATLIAEGRIDEVVRLTDEHSYTADDIAFSLSEYPHRPAIPPPDHRIHFRYGPMTGKPETWQALIPFFTAREGRSDLEMELQFDFSSAPPRVSLLGIRVP